MILDDVDNSCGRFGNRFKTGTARFVAQKADIEIGDDVLFSNGITVRTSDMHSIYDARTKERLNPPEGVRIADHVWVGQDVIIGKGAVIGRDSVIAARSFVAGVVGSGVVAGGTPAKVLRSGITWGHED